MMVETLVRSVGESVKKPQEKIIEKSQMPQQRDNFYTNILRQVVQENWAGKTQQGSAKPIAITALEEHATRMHNLLGTLEYEYMCMPNVIAHAKKMERDELQRYLSSIEAVTAAYKYTYDPDSLSYFVAGLTLKAKDADTVEKHLNNHIHKLEHKASTLAIKSDKERREAEAVSKEIARRKGSLLRFLKKGEISLLNSNLELRSKRIRAFSKGAQRYYGIVLKIKEMAKKQ